MEMLENADRPGWKSKFPTGSPACSTFPQSTAPHYAARVHTLLPPVSCLRLNPLKNAKRYIFFAVGVLRLKIIL